MVGVLGGSTWWVNLMWSLRWTASAEAETQLAGCRLATEAMTRGSNDNITVIVAFLKPVSTLENVYTQGKRHSRWQ